MNPLGDSPDEGGDGEDGEAVGVAEDKEPEGVGNGLEEELVA